VNPRKSKTSGFLQVVQERLRFMLVLEADDRIVRIADHDHVSGSLVASPDVRQDRRDHCALRGTTAAAFASSLDDTDSQPLRHEAKDALVRDPVLEKAESP
jgi:hypothetical protein